VSLRFPRATLTVGPRATTSRFVYRYMEQQIAALPILVLPSEYLAGHCRKVLIARVPRFGWAPANLNYLASAVSCCFVCLSAVFTAARNDSVPAGACTSPDRILRKDMFLP